MNKLLKAFCIGLAIVTQQLHSISVTDYIQQYGMPKVSYSGTLNLLYKDLTDLTGLQDIPHINQVRELNLSCNQIQTLPVTIFNGLHNLIELNLSGNQIKTLPGTIFNGLHNLKRLNLSGNKIKTLPDTIFNDLQNLWYLNLDNNQLQTLPATIFNGLHNLGYLNLDNNRIQTLSDTIFNGLHKLRELYLGSNQIQALPDTINGLHNLGLLNLSNNQIQTLPDTIFNGLQSLKFLRLQGNSFTPEFIPTLTDLLLNLPKLEKVNGIPKSEALRKPPFGTLKKLAVANIVQNLDNYLPNLHKLPADILDLLPLNEQQKQEIDKRQLA